MCVCVCVCVEEEREREEEKGGCRGEGVASEWGGMGVDSKKKKIVWWPFKSLAQRTTLKKITQKKIIQNFYMENPYKC